MAPPLRWYVRRPPHGHLFIFPIGNLSLDVKNSPYYKNQDVRVGTQAKLWYTAATHTEHKFYSRSISDR
jgi:hypothetical protein